MGNQVMSLKEMDRWFTSREDMLAERIVALGVEPKRMIKLAVLAIQSNGALLKCRPSSIFVALMEAAALKLEPTLGHAYLVPYGNEARMQIGYRGLIELAQRSGLVGAVHADVVHERDDFQFQQGTTPLIVHRKFVPEITGSPLELTEADLEEMTPGPMRLFYSVVHLRGLEVPAMDVMTIPEVEAIRRRAKSFKAKTSPWLTDYEAMGQKTVLKRTLWRRVRSSVELSAAIQMDSSVEGGRPRRLYEIDESFGGLRDIAASLGEGDGEEEAGNGSDSDALNRALAGVDDG